MMEHKLQPYQRQEIIEKARQGFAYPELAETYGVSRAYVNTICKKAGITRRGTIKNDIECPNCRTKLILPNGVERIKHCYICGKKILTPNEEAMEGLVKVMERIRHLPENMRDESIDQLRTAIEMLRGAR